MVEISRVEESELAPETSGVRMPWNHATEVAFSSPLSGHMVLAFHQGSGPEAQKHGSTHTGL